MQEIIAPSEGVIVSTTFQDSHGRHHKDIESANYSQLMIDLHNYVQTSNRPQMHGTSLQGIDDLTNWLIDIAGDSKFIRLIRQIKQKPPSTKT